MRDMRSGETSRRTFLAQGAAGMAAMAGAAPAAPRGANDRLGIGLIGVGGRGSDHLSELVKAAGSQNLRITSICDVWRPAREAAAARVAKGTGGEPPATCSRFGELLARGDVDAVVIATPDFSHGTILNAALEAGKDVYVEKPMTIDLESANRALDTARAKGRIVQAGTQRRSDGHFRAGAEVVRSGRLGTLSRVSARVGFNEARWIRNTSNCRAEDVDWPAFLLGLISERPFDAKLLRQWQLYRATSNGLPGLWMTHYADAVHLMTGAGYPRSAAAHGGIFVWKDGREHADTFTAVVEYPEGFLFDWSMDLGHASGLSFDLFGTKAALDAERWTVTPEGVKGAKPEPIAPVASVSHLVNWLECVRSRQEPNADIAKGHQHVVATVMAARALETGRRVVYDAERRAIATA